MQHPASIFALFSWFIIIVHFILKKLIANDEDEDLEQTEGRFTDLMITWILIIVAVITAFLIDLHDPDSLRLFVQLITIVSLGTRSYLEWKYLENSKKFIVSLIVLILSLIFLQLIIN
ncbi:protein of unknown function [Pelagirhabdus alkalitolerans]|uniref:DUF4181 domain-containing protein n=1 Tax=Pelagirhabdus alkalitolerans TaxID=1612202 RepID=A0A1G6GMP6_9BACI|nr:DUF4181 domain-containing protein [Pelagirhabdus alkalitolerans]SDB83237.1 protein of unknown function [Pelagirhabdus alkalitolerans]